MAKYGDGWMVNTLDLRLISEGVVRLKSAFAAHGRDPDSLKVHAEFDPIYKDGGAIDFDRMFDRAPAMIDAGITTLSITPGRYCKNIDEVEALFDRVVALKASLNG